MTERFKLEDIGFVYDNGTLIGMYEIVDCLNDLHDENKQLKNENANLLGAIDLLSKNLEKQFNRKKELYTQLEYAQIFIELQDVLYDLVERGLIDLTEKRDKVNVDDVIGIVKTDNPTDSVALKKEAQLIICEKRLIELEKENEQLKLDKQQLHRAMSREEVRHKQFQDKVFALIDEKIREYSNLEQRERTSSDTITILKELKKELESE